MHIKCVSYVLFAIGSYSYLQGSSDLLFVPLSPTPTGIQAFFKNIFNAPLYAKEVLPNSTLHIEQLLGIGRKEQLPIEYTTTVLWLFHVKALEARYIDAQALEQFINSLESVLDYHIQPTAEKQIPKEIVKNTILNSFATQAEQIANNPNVFFDSIADQIIKKLQTWIEQEQAVTNLRHSLGMLLQTMSHKLIWDITNPMFWQQVKRLADQLSGLEKGHMLDKTQLNTIYWTLILRICYLIELQASVIPLDVYQEMISDITDSDHPLLRLTDAEPNITTKAEKLRQAVLDNGGLARAQARTEYGIIT